MKEDGSLNENKCGDSSGQSCSEEDEVFLTHRETAEMLRICTNSLYRWNRVKKGPPLIKTQAGRILYSKKDVLKFLQNSKQ